MRLTLPTRSFLSSLLPGARTGTAISRTETGGLVQWKPRIQAGPDDYPQPKTQKFDYESMPPDPPTKKFKSLFVGVSSVVIGFGLPVWIIYSQVLLRQNKERAQEFVETLPIDDEVLRRAEIALAKKAEQEEALRRRREGGLYEPRKPVATVV